MNVTDSLQSTISDAAIEDQTSDNIETVANILSLLASSSTVNEEVSIHLIPNSVYA